jgi:hypothetical protein
LLFEACGTGIAYPAAMISVVQKEFIGLTDSAITNSRELLSGQGSSLDLVSCYFEPSPACSVPSVVFTFRTGANNPSAISQCRFKSDKLELALTGSPEVFLHVDETVLLTSPEGIVWTGDTSGDVVKNQATPSSALSSWLTYHQVTSNVTLWDSCLHGHPYRHKRFRLMLSLFPPKAQMRLFQKQ